VTESPAPAPWIEDQHALARITFALFGEKLAHHLLSRCDCKNTREGIMNNVIYIVGLVVVVLAVLAFFGLR